MTMLANYSIALEGLQRKARLRRLASLCGIDFTSNDFLALANAPRMKAAILAAMDRGFRLEPEVRVCCVATIWNTKLSKWKPPLFRCRKRSLFRQWLYGQLRAFRDFAKT